MKRSFVISTFSTLIAIIILLISFYAPGEQAPNTTSVGGPNNGKLLNGAKMPTSGKGFYSNPWTTNREAKYGTDELIDALMTIGSDMERWAPGATLIINDLGFKQGGKIPRHQSHQAGRDVDLLFYTVDKAGKILRSRAHRFDEKGRAMGESAGSVFFDTKRNWLVIKSLIQHPDTHLQRVFVAERLRALMLDHAQKTGETAWLIERAGEVMCEPRVPHDDHFHVRISCTIEDYRQGCRDSWPIFPWRRTEFARIGIFNVETAPPALRRTTKSKAKSRPRRPRKNSPGRVWCP